MIGDILKSMNLVTQHQIDQAITIQEKTNERIGQVLVKLGIITPQNLARALAQEHHLEYCDVLAQNIPPDVIALIPEEQCIRYTLIPIKADEHTVTIALADPLNLIALDNLRMFLAKDIQGVLSTDNDITEAIKRHYGSEQHTSKNIHVDNTINPHDEENIIHLMTAGAGALSEDEAPVVKLVSHIILEAFKRRASDIHVEPFADRVRIRYRIDGILHDVKSLPKTLQGTVISRLKIMAKLDIAEKRLPQDGRIKLTIAEKDVDFRVSTLPSMYGESVVLRILDRAQLLLELSDLGFAKREQESFENLINMPNGVILVTGPTGSGKTTTLYTALQTINKPDRKIITVEDPIEYQLSGINQVQIRQNIGLTFASALRSILRQAPNIIMVGEIRDVETARIAIEASLTGHLVFSTLHTNDAPGAVIRLIDMGVKPYLVASSVQAILAQRLVRAICPHCKEEIAPNMKVLELLNINLDDMKEARFFKGRGCEACSHTGYKGRVALLELFRFTDEIRSLLYKSLSRTLLRERARQYGMKTLREDGISKVMQGITTLEEILRVTQTDAN